MTEEVEKYEITEQEALTIRLAQAEVEKASLAFQLAKERQDSLVRELSGKYSEYGTYELLGDINLHKRVGQRRRVRDDEAWTDPETSST